MSVAGVAFQARCMETRQSQNCQSRAEVAVVAVVAVMVVVVSVGIRPRTATGK